MIDIGRYAASGRPSVMVSGDGEWLALCQRPQFSEERTDPRETFFFSHSALDVATGGQWFGPHECEAIRVARLGEEGTCVEADRARLFGVGFSPDSSTYAYLTREASGAVLRVHDLASATCSMVCLGVSLASTIFNDPVAAWVPRRRPRLVVALLVHEPDARDALQEPLIRSWGGEGRDPLERPPDGLTANLATLCTAQLASIGLDGSIERIGSPAPYSGLSISPGGRYLLVSRLHPASGQPVERWPAHSEVWDLQETPAQIVFKSRPQVRWGSGFGAPRSAYWLPHAPASVVYLHDRPEGGSELHSLAAPFTQPPEVLASTSHTFARFCWSTSGTLLVWEFEVQSARMRLVATHRDRARSVCEYTSERFDTARTPPWQDASETAPGEARPVLQGPLHTGLVQQLGEELLLSRQECIGEHTSLTLETIDLSSGTRRQRYTSESGFLEAPSRAMAHGESVFIIRESPSVPPTVVLADLARSSRPCVRETRAGRSSSAPAFRAIRIRDDVVVFLPPNAGPKRVPFLLCPSPTMGASPSPSFNADRHIGIRGASPLWALHAGFGVAVQDGPRLDRVFGSAAHPGAEVARSLESTAALLEASGWGNGEVVLIGHCFGAYVVAMALGHSHRFSAGIGMSGLYSLATRPLGSEFTAYRPIWERPDLFVERSPISLSHRITSPLLLFHGARDTVVPITSSETFFGALEQSRGVHRYVAFPTQGHIYTSRSAVTVFAREVGSWCRQYTAT